MSEPLAFYNEIDPYAAQWLRNLIDAGAIAPGVVDTRSITEIEPNELLRYTQCHFFAGIGVWSYALRQADWPDDRPVWTGSCPCQPFSGAGGLAGFADERHLWPHFFWLIEQCRPPVVFGEQVASKVAEPWLDLVQADLEGVGYRFAGVAFPAAGVGAPNIRDRLYWVGDTDHAGFQGFRGSDKQHDAQGREAKARHCPPPSVADLDGARGFWDFADWLRGADGKHRPVEPGSFPLADGVAGRVGRLRAYGNAINAEAAKAFILSYEDAAR